MNTVLQSPYFAFISFCTFLGVVPKERSSQMKVEDQGVKETATHKRRNTEEKETAAVGKWKRGIAKPENFSRKRSTS